MALPRKYKKAEYIINYRTVLDRLLAIKQELFQLKFNKVLKRDFKPHTYKFLKREFAYLKQKQYFIS